MPSPPTFEEVNTLFAYAPGEGVLIRKKCHFSNLEGKWITGSFVSIRNYPYQTHRVIWLLKTGKWPTETVDHANRDKKDNRDCNLREATPTEQLMNTVRRNIISGARGVEYCNGRSKPWKARIRYGGKNLYLGYFASQREASSAYEIAAKKYYGEFVCLEIK